MAKQNGVIKVRGKLDNKVFVQGRKGLNYVRATAQEGNKKGEVAIRIQYNRTKFLNNLASQLNRLLGSYYQGLKSDDFYLRAQKCFRKEPLDNRCFLLQQLKGLDLHPGHMLSKMGHTLLDIQIKGEMLVIILRTGSHPYGKYKANCYFHELSLISWNEENDLPAIQQRFSDWVPISNMGKTKKPSFRFEFPIAGAQHWILCQRQSTGINQKELEYLSTQGMSIIEAGSFDKAEQEFMEKELAERKLTLLAERSEKIPKEEVARVKAIEE